MKRCTTALLAVVFTAATIITNVTNVYAVTSSTSVTPDFSWITTGAAGQELSSPWNIAIAPNGNIYVVDTGNHSIKVFTSQGNFVTQWGGQGADDGQFELPTGIAIASNGDVFVMDMSNYRVQKFTSNGTFITSWGSGGMGDNEFTMGTALTLTNNGNILVADYLGVVKEFTQDGTFVKKWTRDRDETPAVYGMAVAANGDVYFTLPTEGKVQRYSSEGVFISEWGGDGNGDGEFGVSSGIGPIGLAITQNGHVYVTDGGNNRVQEFTSDGTFVAKWGETGTGSGQFSTPFGIASDANGNMYVADSGNNRVQRYFFPQNRSIIATGSSAIKLTLPQGCDINNHSVINPAKVDEAFSYPLGFTSFTFATPNCESGATVPVMVTFITDLKPSDVVARKFNATTQTYGAIPGATITETTVDGKHALQISYSVTDGGELDEDGVANGIIVDPVGLGVPSGATINNNIPGAPNTGVGPAGSYNSSTLLFATIVSFCVVGFSVLLYRFTKR